MPGRVGRSDPSAPAESAFEADTGEDVDEESVSLRDRMRAETNASGQPVAFRRSAAIAARW